MDALNSYNKWKILGQQLLIFQKIHLDPHYLLTRKKINFSDLEIFERIDLISDEGPRDPFDIRSMTFMTYAEESKNQSSWDEIKPNLNHMLGNFEPYKKSPFSQDVIKRYKEIPTDFLKEDMVIYNFFTTKKEKVMIKEIITTFWREKHDK